MSASASSAATPALEDKKATPKEQTRVLVLGDEKFLQLQGCGTYNIAQLSTCNISGFKYHNSYSNNPNTPKKDLHTLITDNTRNDFTTTTSCPDTLPCRVVAVGQTSDQNISQPVFIYPASAMDAKKDQRYHPYQMVLDLSDEKKDPYYEKKDHYKLEKGSLLIVDGIRSNRPKYEVATIHTDQYRKKQQGRPIAIKFGDSNYKVIVMCAHEDTIGDTLNALSQQNNYSCLGYYRGNHLNRAQDIKLSLYGLSEAVSTELNSFYYHITINQLTLIYSSQCSATDIEALNQDAANTAFQHFKQFMTNSQLVALQQHDYALNRARSKEAITALLTEYKEGDPNRRTVEQKLTTLQFDAEKAKLAQLQKTLEELKKKEMNLLSKLSALNKKSADTKSVDTPPAAPVASAPSMPRPTS